MFVLAIDTSSAAVTAAVLSTDDDAAGSMRATLAARGHGELLSPMIGECLDEAGVAARNVGAVVAGTGPGPYTGLRVGLVTAAAFADAIGVPTYGVCSLDAVGARDALVVTDARRKEVYWARFDADGARVTGPDVARPADVPLDGVTAIAGAALDLYPDAWPDDARRLDARHPEARLLVALARDRIDSGAPGEVLEPLYLRRPDAVVPGAPKTVTPR